MTVVLWCGRSGEELKAFPDAVRGKLGYQLFLVQRGQTPPGTKPIRVYAAHRLRLLARLSWLYTRNMREVNTWR